MSYSWINECKVLTYKILLDLVHLIAAVIIPFQVENVLNLSEWMELVFVHYVVQKLKIKESWRALS